MEQVYKNDSMANVQLIKDKWPKLNVDYYQYNKNVAVSNVEIAKIKQ